jgi:hypothetical protein
VDGRHDGINDDLELWQRANDNGGKLAHHCGAQQHWVSVWGAKHSGATMVGAAAFATICQPQALIGKLSKKAK